VGAASVGVAKHPIQHLFPRSRASATLRTRTSMRPFGNKIIHLQWPICLAILLATNGPELRGSLTKASSAAIGPVLDFSSKSTIRAAVMFELSETLITELQSMDTPTVCNALELLVPERRGYGYTTKPLVCTRPELPPLVGIARTARIRAAHPNDVRVKAARETSDGYYAYIDAGPKPSVVIIQDIDGDRAYGAYWGEVNSNIHMGLGCCGVITDGSVRDLPDVATGFQMIADRIGPSHAFVHVVDYAQNITVAGMRVTDGDLIHADQHGAVVIPHDVADKVKGAADDVAKRERIIIEAAQQPGFDIDQLRAAQGAAAEIY